MPKGNRETKKPKQDKPKPAAVASPFAAQGRGAPPASPPGKKKQPPMSKLRFGAPLYLYFDHSRPDLGMAPVVDVDEGLHVMQRGPMARYRFASRARAGGRASSSLSEGPGVVCGRRRSTKYGGNRFRLLRLQPQEEGRDEAAAPLLPARAGLHAARPWQRQPRPGEADRGDPPPPRRDRRRAAGAAGLPGAGPGAAAGPSPAPAGARRRGGREERLRQGARVEPKRRAAPERDHSQRLRPKRPLKRL